MAQYYGEESVFNEKVTLIKGAQLYGKIDGNIEATGDIIGNVTGNVTGNINSTGISTFNVINAGIGGTVLIVNDDGVGIYQNPNSSFDLHLTGSVGNSNSFINFGLNSPLNLKISTPSAVNIINGTTLFGDPITYPPSYEPQVISIAGTTNTIFNVDNILGRYTDPLFIQGRGGTSFNGTDIEVSGSFTVDVANDSNFTLGGSNTLIQQTGSLVVSNSYSVANAGVGTTAVISLDPADYSLFGVNKFYIPAVVSGALVGLNTVVVTPFQGKVLEQLTIGSIDATTGAQNLLWYPSSTIFGKKVSGSSGSTTNSTTLVDVTGTSFSIIPRVPNSTILIEWSFSCQPSVADYSAYLDNELTAAYQTALSSGTAVGTEYVVYFDEFITAGATLDADTIFIGVMPISFRSVYGAATGNTLTVGNTYTFVLRHRCLVGSVLLPVNTQGVIGTLTEYL